MSQILQTKYVERFWSKVKKTDSCWIWIAGKKSTGYGQYWDGNKKVHPHRFAYQQIKGKIPDGLTIDHLCRNKLCHY